MTERCPSEKSSLLATSRLTKWIQWAAFLAAKRSFVVLVHTETLCTGVVEVQEEWIYSRAHVLPSFGTQPSHRNEKQESNEEVCCLWKT